MSISTPLPESDRPVEILLVDDDDEDVLLTQKAFERDRFPSRVHRAQNGLEAIAFLRREDPFLNAVRPDLILLDLNMPLKCGREVLREVKQTPEFCRIPVVVLTTSADERDIAESYQHQANSFITKPADLVEFRAALSTLKDYWFNVVQLPNTT